MTRQARLWWILCAFALIIISGCREENPTDQYSILRESLVEAVQKRGIQDSSVLAALRAVPRHLFVPGDLRLDAYDDVPLPIGEEQTISQPYIVALMTQALQLDSSQRVLEIGTGSGYQAAVASVLCDTVYTIELNYKLGKQARRRLKELGYENVVTKVGDGYMGWKEHAPFDGIIVTCSPTHVPAPLTEQLAEGGRIVIPVGKEGEQELLTLTKRDGKLVEQSLLPVRFVPMLREDGHPY